MYKDRAKKLKAKRLLKKQSEFTGKVLNQFFKESYVGYYDNADNHTLQDGLYKLGKYYVFREL